MKLSCSSRKSAPTAPATSSVATKPRRKDRADRQAIVEGLQIQLKRGEKAVVGNKGYHRYLKVTVRDDDKPAFEIDVGKLAEEARYDGIFVLRTNARISPLQAVLRYHDFLKVEELFRPAKAVTKTRPINHSSDEGHPRPCLLLVPGLAAAERACRSLPGRQGREDRMAGSPT